MEKLVDEGLVKSIGLSNFNESQIERVIKSCRIKPSNLQVLYSVTELWELDFRHARAIEVKYMYLQNPLNKTLGFR